MLRSLVLILLLVNAGFFAWSHGWLNDVVGVKPDAQHEPQRLNREVQADKIVVLAPASGQQARSTASSAASAMAAASESASAASAASGVEATVVAASAPASMPTVVSAASSASSATVALAKKQPATLCVEAGPFMANEVGEVQASLRNALPAGSWQTDTVMVPGQWLIYMGPYPDADLFARKQTELRRIKGLAFEEVTSPANLAHGLSLGKFNQQTKAEAALNAVKTRGIRTARVVNVRPSMDVQVVRVAQASERMQVSLASLKLPHGKGFTACP